MLGSWIFWRLFPDFGWVSLLCMLALPFPMLAFGLVVLGLSAEKQFAIYQIELDVQFLKWQRNLLGWKTGCKVPRHSIRHISLIRLGRPADETKEGVEIRAGKKRFRFGASLSTQERAGLVHEMRHSVFGEPVVREAPLSMVALPPRFSFRVTYRMLHELPFACAAVALGSLFLFVAIRFMRFETLKLESREPLFFRLLEWIFSIIGNVGFIAVTLIALAILGGGVALIVRAIRKNGREISVDGDESVIVVREFRKGHAGAERVFQRCEVTGLRASIHSQTGGILSKRIELLMGDASETIAAPVHSDEADAILAELNEASHRDANGFTAGTH
jgi:hypothetical protein